MLDKRRLATHHLQSSIRANPISMNVQQLATILPPSVISEDLTVKEMVRQLTILKHNDMLDVGMLGSSSEGFGSFSITTEGILLVKKIFRDIKKSVKDKKVYEKKIEDTEGNSGTKKWLRGMWDKFKDKAQDEIVDEILSQTKIYGPQLIGFMIRFIQDGS